MRDDLPRFDPDRDYGMEGKANRTAVSRYKGGGYRATQFRNSLHGEQKGGLSVYLLRTFTVYLSDEV